jgi:amino acid transporter
VLAFYAAFWAYGGYDNVGNIVEEIAQPLRRNVPLSVISALLLVIAIYVLSNDSNIHPLNNDPTPSNCYFVGAP